MAITATFVPGVGLLSVFGGGDHVLLGGGGLDVLDGGPGDNIVIQSLMAALPPQDLFS